MRYFIAARSTSYSHLFYNSKAPSHCVVSGSMVKTKTTPRSSNEHRFHCENCDYSTNRKSNLVRHVKRHTHEDPDLNDLDPGILSDILGTDDRSSETTDIESSESEDECRNERDLVFTNSQQTNKDPPLSYEADHEESEIESQCSTRDQDILSGRVVRKRTNPDPIPAPQRKLPPPRPAAPSVKGVSAKVSAKDPRNCIPVRIPRPSTSSMIFTVPDEPAPSHPTTSEGSAQTEPFGTASIYQSSQTESQRRHLVRWKCTKYREGDRDVEEIELEEQDLF